MPVLFREDRGCGVLELRGAYTVGEAREALMQGLASFSRERPAGLIIDVSASDMVADRASDDIVRAARGMGRLGDKFSNRLGVVAPSALTFGLMRMGGVHAEEAGLSVCVCHTYEGAVSWLVGTGGAGN